MTISGDVGGAGRRRFRSGLNALDRARTLDAGYEPGDAFEEYGAVRRHGGDRPYRIGAGKAMGWRRVFGGRVKASLNGFLG